MKRFFPVAIMTVLMFLVPLQTGRISAGPDVHNELFQTSDRCFACHNGLATSAGEDISIGLSWRSTMMANSARDPYWQAGVRRGTPGPPMDFGGVQGRCARCATPGGDDRSR